MHKVTQKVTVLSLLSDGRTVSKLVALHIGIGNLNEVIRRLRGDGWRIDTITDYDARERPFTRYLLDASQRAEARGVLFAHAQTVGGLTPSLREKRKAA